MKKDQLRRLAEIEGPARTLARLRDKAQRTQSLAKRRKIFRTAAELVRNPSVWKAHSHPWRNLPRLRRNPSLSSFFSKPEYQQFYHPLTPEIQEILSTQRRNPRRMAEETSECLQCGSPMALSRLTCAVTGNPVSECSKGYAAYSCSDTGRECEPYCDDCFETPSRNPSSRNWGPSLYNPLEHQHNFPEPSSDFFE